MFEAYKYTNSLSTKLAISAVVSIFSPFKVELIILCIMILIDTITGGAYALKIKKFCSSGLRRGFKKIIFYSLCIIVIRLLEIGLASLVTTNLLTNIVISFLIITEAISSLENLTLLGVPLPSGLAKFIIKQIKSETVRELVLSGIHKKEYMNEINDMLDFNLPNIKDQHYKKLLEIKFNEWALLVNYIDNEFSTIYSENKEILFFRIFTLINATMIRIHEKWVIEGIPTNYIQSFNDWHDPIVKKWITSVKLLCFNEDDMDKKRVQIIEKLIVALYRTLTDIQKVEFFK